MLRPATPLSILLFASFVLLLISVLSTPIIKGIPLARNNGVSYGVFGWCTDNGQCSSVQVGWKTDDMPTGGNDDFNLPSNTRHSLSSLLIVHPVAALCNLIVLGLAVAAHFHSPSHSARYLLSLLVLLLPTLLVTLLAFLVDILLFVPHLQWGGWIVLASTILITASGVVTCAMRRTLVSRKARKKRIAENAEMSGADFYARQAAEESKMTPPPSTESKVPMVNGAPGADALPSFATFTPTRSEEGPMNGPSPTDPLSATSPLDGRYYGGQRSRSNSHPQRDEFGAPLGAARSMEDRPPMPGPSPNRGGYGPPRGGYPPRGANSSRGSFNSRGPPPASYRGRGGYPPRGRGGYPQGAPPLGGMVPIGMNRRPPPGYGPQIPQGPPDGYVPPPIGAANAYAQPGQPGDPLNEPYSPSNYGSEIPPGQGNLAYGARTLSPAQRRQSPYGSRTQSPSGGHPVQEMPPAMPPMPDQYGPSSHDRRITGMTQDSDVLGMVEMQRVRPQMQRDPSSDAYIPPRAGWSNNPEAGPRSPVRRKRLDSASSDYVEDVDPKFAEPSNASSAPPPEAFNEPNVTRPGIPSLLIAGHNPHDPSPESSNSQVNSHLPRSNSYEDLHPGARSPVESETSNFTSISQRPMNPNWQPGHGGEFNSFGPERSHQQQRKQDMLFSGNPDFELPGMGPPRGRGGYRGRGEYGRQGPMRPPHPSVLDNMSGDGRYPTPVPPPGAGNSVGMREM